MTVAKQNNAQLQPAAITRTFQSMMVVMVVVLAQKIVKIVLNGFGYAWAFL